VILIDVKLDHMEAVTTEKNLNTGRRMLAFPVRRTR
jgi:hypothetical protein